MNNRMGGLILLGLACLFVLSACGSSPELNAIPTIPGLAATLAAQTMDASSRFIFPTQQPTATDFAPRLPTDLPALSPADPASSQPLVEVAANLAQPALLPTFTPLPKPTQVPRLTPFSVIAADTRCTNIAEFVRDVTIQDGDTVRPGKKFVKTWQLKNSGTCTWSPNYQIIFVWGDQLGGASPIQLGQTVKPGETINVSIEMKAPLMPGLYQSDWMLESSDGEQFGTGYKALQHIWAAIDCGILSTGGDRSGSGGCKGGGGG